MKPDLKSLVHDLAAEEILSYIRSNCLMPGARLPSERELAEKLKVSRHTVREAYLSLAARGTVLIERGRGAFLATPIGEMRQYPLIKDIADAKNLANLLEVRQLIECGAIPLAVQRAVQQDYLRLRELIAAEEGRPVYHKGIVIPSVAFEFEIVSLSQNTSLINLEKNVIDSWKNLWVHLGLSSLKPIARASEHYEIVDAMEEGNVKLAQMALHAHLSSILLVIERAARR